MPTYDAASVRERAKQWATDALKFDAAFTATCLSFYISGATRSIARLISVWEQMTCRYSLLAEGQFHAEHRAWAAFRSEYGASDVKDWRVVGFQPRFADQPAHVARVDREQS